MKKQTLINFVYLFFATLWVPLREFYIKIDGANRIVFHVIILVFFTNLQKKTFQKAVFKNSIVRIWSIWVLYAIVNTSLQDGFGEQGVLFGSVLMIIQPWVTLQVVIYEYLKNERKLVTYLVPLIFLTGIVYLLNLNSLEISSTIRNRDVAFGNGEAILMTILVAVTSLAWLKGYVSSRKVIVVVLLSLFMIIYISTRKAFVASLFILVVTAIIKFEMNLKNVVIFIFFSLGVIIGATYTLQNTALGERFRNIEVEGEQFNKSEIDALKYLGDRAVQYSVAPKYFVEKPFFGIGLSNYVTKTPSAYKLHSELLVQIVELGVLGFILYLIFQYNIASKLIRLKRKTGAKKRLQFLLSAWLVIMFFSVTTWTYQFNKYFILYAIIIAEIIKYENSYTYKNR